MALRVAADFVRPDGTESTQYAFPNSLPEAIEKVKEYAEFGVSELVDGNNTFYPSHSVRKIVIESI